MFDEFHDAGHWHRQRGRERSTVDAPPRPSDEALLDAYSRAVTHVVDEVGDAVVRVDVRDAKRQRGGSGSGVAVASDGLILTNSHVVSGQHRVELALTDGRRLCGRVIGDDPDTDLALVRTEEPARARERAARRFQGACGAASSSWRSAIRSASNRP